MKTARRIFITLSIIWLALSAQIRADPIITINQIDPSHFPEMTLYITISDSAGEASPLFTKDDFVVTEDGTAGDVTDFVGAGENRPVDIVFVFDTTGSMSEEIDGVKNSAISFANQLRDNGRDFRLGLVSFGDDIREVWNRDGSLTSDANEFRNWISRLNADGGDDEPENALDGLLRATQMTFRDRSQKVLILITDAPPHERGDGTRFSNTTTEQVVQDLQNQGITVYAVAYDDLRFRHLADETSGSFYPLTRSSDFTGIIDELGGVIAAQYKLTYTSPRPANDGTRRNIVVKVGSVEAGTTFLEPHLLTVDSRWGTGLLLLVPLILLLAGPSAMGFVRRRQDMVPSRLKDPGPIIGADVPFDAVKSRDIPIATTGARCPHCDQPLLVDSRFCASCGRSVVPPQAATPVNLCPNCRRPLRTGSRFCSGCGHQL